MDLLELEAAGTTCIDTSIEFWNKKIKTQEVSNFLEFLKGVLGIQILDFRPFPFQTNKNLS